MADVEFALDRTALARVASSAGDLVERLAEASATDMRRTAPVDTGDMVSTVRVERESETVMAIRCGGQAGAATGAWVDYVPYVELGTSRAPAQPFMRPALYRLRAAL